MPGPCLLPGGGLRLPRLGLPRLGLLGAGLKPGSGLLGRRDLRLEPGPQPGLVPLGVPAGLRHLLLRGPAHPVQLRPGRLGRLPRPCRVPPGLAGPGLGPGRPRLRASHCLVPLLPRRGHLLLRGPAHPVQLRPGRLGRFPLLSQPRLSLRTRLPRLSPGPLGRRDLRLEPGPQPGLVPLGVPAGLRHLLLRGPAHPVQLRPGRLGRFPRLSQPRLSLRTRLPRLSPGPLGRRDLRLEPGPQPGLVPLGVPAGLRHLLLRGPAHPVQLRPGRLGRPGLRSGHRLVPLLPRRGRPLLRGPRLLPGGGLRLPRLSQPRLSLRTRLPRLSPGPLGRRDLRLEPGPQPGLVPLGVPAGLRHLLLRGPAHPVQLRPGRLGRPGLRSGHRLVPLLPRRGRPLLRGPRLLPGGGLRLPRLSQPRLSLRTRLPRLSPGPLGRHDLRLEPGPQPGLVPLGIPAGLRHLLLRGPAHPVQLRPGRLGRLPRPCRVPPGLAGPGLGPGRPRLGPGRPGLRASHRLVPLLPRRGHLLLSGPRLLPGDRRRLPRLSQPRLSLRRRSTRLPRLSLGPLAAPPEREPRPTRTPRVGRPATWPGHHVAPPEPGRRQMLLPGHRVRQPAAPLLCRPRLARPRLILTARTGPLRTPSPALTIGRLRSAHPDSVIRPPRAGSTRHTPRELRPALLRRADRSRAGELRAAASATFITPPPR